MRLGNHFMRKTFFLVLFVSSAAFALPPDGTHYVLEPQHTLQPAEIAELRAKGVIIGPALGANRFMVRVSDRAAVEGDLRIRSLEPYDWTQKIAPSAYAEAAKARPFGRVRVMFHEGVGFDEARGAIESAGGVLESPFATQWQLPNALVVRLPGGAMQNLARDERVFGIYGPPLRVQTDNVVAAGLSKVTPLFSAPYNLSGAGVALSEFELAVAETTHPQFQGRMTAHFTGAADANNALHATHVAGTIISAGITDSRDTRAPNSKGMAPAATLHEFNVIDDFANIVSNKDTQLKPLGVAADNNSWDFVLGWSGDSQSGLSVWNGDFFGAYDPVYSSPYDAVTTHSGSPLFVHSAGNDALMTDPSFTGMSAHLHCCTASGDTIRSETFCYSQSGSGNDCTAPCSTGMSTITGEPHCETTHHHIQGPFGVVGLEASVKNVVSVGAVDLNGVIAPFSSRGPARDGRIKPEVVAKGLSQFSTVPGGYGTRSGTSMSSPVVTGTSGLLTEQWRKTFNGQSPSGAVLKTLLIAGADDQIGDQISDLPGPDYTYGFGLVDAKNSVDLILADGGTGSRIRTGTLNNGDTVEFPLSVAAPQNLRVVLGWFDPEIFPKPEDPLELPTLLNDLDVKVIDPSGQTVLPYVLDKAHPTQAATRGVNTIDTTEEVEIKNAAAGQYRVIITAKLGDLAKHPTQDFVLIANSSLTNAVPPCGDTFEPNDTQALAFKYVGNAQLVSARTCSATDFDFFDINVMKAGPLSATVTATDTPLRVTLSGNGLTPIVVDVPVQSARTLSATAAVGIYDVEVQPNGAIGSTSTYTLTATFSQPSVSHRRATRH